ncbi:hypothetical protein WSS15_28210 [Acetobacter pasteurianus]|nr:hypothetical protein WSS15_28210 [Acetobacter pasteurianus]
MNYHFSMGFCRPPKSQLEKAARIILRKYAFYRGYMEDSQKAATRNHDPQIQASI